MLKILIASTALSAFAAPLSAQTVSTRQIGSATLQNVPDIPAAVSEAVQRYQNSRAAQFEDWLPDGSMLIATRFGATQQIHHVAAPGGARTQISFGAEPVAEARVIPGSDRFVLTRDNGGDEWFQLYARGLAGTAVQLTEPGTRNQSPVFSRDGSLLLWAKAVKGSAAYDLLAVDPKAGGAPRTLYRSDGAIGPADISADKARLIFVRSFSNTEDQLFELDVATGEATRIAPRANKAVYQDPRYLPGGRSLIAISDRDSDTRQLIEVDIATGKATVLTPGLKWDVESYDLTDDGRVLAYAINEDGFSRVVLQDRLTRRALPQPELPKGVLTALKFSGDGKRLAVGLTSATWAGDVWSWDVEGAALTRWTTSELGDLDPARLAEPELIRFRSFDGLSVPAFVYRPRGVPDGEKTPVVIDIHGGPEAQTRPIWNYGAQYFADVLKATVILPNVRGSDGYGKRYLNLDNAEKREDSVRDIGALLDWIAAQPGLDKDRVAVYGQSYGGYMSLAVMSHYSDRLVGGVERYGISNWTSFLQNTEAYRRDNRRAEYGDERDPKMAKIFEKISPMNNVARITKPMLVMQGANDPRVPQSESEQVVAKLRAGGNEAWYVLFADEGHGFLKKPNNDLRREVETVFLRRLFDGK
ncbi:S9 family peptidase [Rhizorhabdus dicambivorans]|uniref:S9 family peptidase n=1 Tax=Rhizorhabdus dicambivorans TaxID=1850238 RepID=A0A2A4G2A1_9SPHN|nr:prolyl oligopeptidase family serine peptidase [Rhizorhabdus dicambivorans]ATE67285.1 S9 family peptidase [Rhizorhabdus dicambivorans]PCE44162.1 S9 family peptidase [Rhizorhabdus dicambivorans]